MYTLYTETSENRQDFLLLLLNYLLVLMGGPAFLIFFFREDYIHITMKDDREKLLETSAQRYNNLGKNCF